MDYKRNDQYLGYLQNKISNGNDTRSNTNNPQPSWNKKNEEKIQKIQQKTNESRVDQTPSEAEMTNF